MVDISNKTSSLRTAKASALLKCSQKTMRLIRENKLPKGNLFDTARAAGFLGGKKTAELIPHCHPLSIDNMEIDFVLLDGKDEEKQNRCAIEVTVQAKSLGRTGIEMETLTALSITCLTLYDLLKPLKDPLLEITRQRLLEKKGGKSDKHLQVQGNFTAAVLVCSDSTAQGQREDNSGKVIQELLQKYNVEVVHYVITPDEPRQIAEIVQDWVKQGVDFIFTTGGTGLGPRDNTVQTLQPLLHKQLPGVEEAMRRYGQDRTAAAMFSRSLAGSIEKTTLLALPGSSAGARESLQAVLPALFHSKRMLQGQGH